jgi:hypothetical protein
MAAVVALENTARHRVLLRRKSGSKLAIRTAKDGDVKSPLQQRSKGRTAT